MRFKLLLLLTTLLLIIGISEVNGEVICYLGADDLITFSQTLPTHQITNELLINPSSLIFRYNSSWVSHYLFCSLGFYLIIYCTLVIV
jgi:hypothetical protein